MLYDSYLAVAATASGLLPLEHGIYVFYPNGKPAFPAPWRRIVLPGQGPTPDNPVVGGLFGDLFGSTFAGGTDTTPWGISSHAWIRYSDRTPVKGRDYHQVLAAPHLAPGQMAGYFGEISQTGGCSSTGQSGRYSPRCILSTAEGPLL